MKPYAEIYVIDLYTLEPLGQISEYKGLIFSESFIGCGKFELYTPVIESNTELLKDGNILYLDKDHCGVILGIDTIINDSGEKVLKVTGTTMEVLLTTRIVWGTYSTTSKRPDSIIFELIDSNCINPSDNNRVIPFLELGHIDLSYPLEEVTHQQTGGEVYEDCKILCNTYNIGLGLSLDLKNKKIIANIRYGTDRSTGQSEHDFVLFSTEMQDIISSEYTKNVKDLKTIALVAGEDSGENRKTVTVGDTTSVGFDRKEMYIDARDLQSDTSGISVESSLTARGLEKLSEKIVRESFKTTIRQDSTSYKYGENYYLGDTITAEDKELGVQVDVVITEMEYEWDGDKFSLTPTLGYKSLRLIDKVKTMIG